METIVTSDHCHGDHLDYRLGYQVVNGEETILVLINFLIKPAMALYHVYGK